MPGPWSRELNDRLAHRHIDLVLDALRADASHQPLPGPALGLADVRALSPEAPGADMRGVSPEAQE